MTETTPLKIEEPVLGASFEDLRHRVEMVDAWPTRFKLVERICAPPT